MKIMYALATAATLSLIGCGSSDSNSNYRSENYHQGYRTERPVGQPLANHLRQVAPPGPRERVAVTPQNSQGIPQIDIGFVHLP